MHLPRKAVSVLEWNKVNWPCWCIFTKIDIDLFIPSCFLLKKFFFAQKSYLEKYGESTSINNGARKVMKNDEKFKFILCFILVRGVKERQFEYEMGGVATLEDRCFLRKCSLFLSFFFFAVLARNEVHCTVLYCILLSNSHQNWYRFFIYLFLHVSIEKR